ncbi:SIR2 family protein [Bifidobacterium sp. MA2]|uniref:SIR2 family protein n=1 Tax=Bifidobacterium santillanense TaxID=2809028 RepID=A0ABS5US72_9BIFI|nr:SIR2 family protein [Bifidobacterium santillanense]MBT1173859.1 SIR2 family protein [Bifidobacterium santillanense]
MDSAAFGREVFDRVSGLLSGINRSPFLFVGSGLSRRYMGSEDWAGLLEWVCDSVGAPMKPLYVYRSQAVNELGGAETPYPLMARLMAADFLDALGSPHMAGWASSHREEFEREGRSPFKVYLCEHLRTFTPRLMTDELDVLRGAANHVAGVITTNYDGLVDSLFPGYQRFVRQDELLFTPVTGVGEIFKIHGSMDDPDSLVITDRDYEHFENRKTYLTAKIMTIFGEFPIIFLGYSLSDPNVLGIISAIAECAGRERARELASRFVFVEFSPDPTGFRIDPRHGVMVSNGSQVEMTCIRTNDFTPIYRAIASTRQLYTPRFLNQLSRQVYSIVYSGHASETVLSRDLEQLGQYPQDAKIVIGVGPERYGRPVDGDDLYRDVLFHDQGLDANLVVGTYLDRMLRSREVPMFHYLAQYDGPLGPRIRQEVAEKRDLDSYLSKTERDRRDRLRGKLRSKDIPGLVHLFRGDAYKHVTLLEQSELDAGQLEELLKPVARDMLERTGKLDSPIRKDIRILDFLRDGVSYRERRTRPSEHCRC